MEGWQKRKLFLMQEIVTLKSEVLEPWTKKRERLNAVQRFHSLTSLVLIVPHPIVVAKDTVERQGV